VRFLISESNEGQRSFRMNVLWPNNGNVKTVTPTG
jgi:hypothetical protein